jgi:hypothetical protein
VGEERAAALSDRTRQRIADQDRLRRGLGVSTAVVGLVPRWRAGQDFVTVSIETRKERGETYDTLKGFFRQYELIYIVGDERDLIRLRTNYRKDPPEDAYLYRTNAPRSQAHRSRARCVLHVSVCRRERDGPQRSLVRPQRFLGRPEGVGQARAGPRGLGRERDRRDLAVGIADHVLEAERHR